VGEHHCSGFLDSVTTFILAAARTKNICLASAVTVLGAADPIRVFQEFGTIDLISGGRAEIIAGRPSFAEVFSLFGLRPEDCDELFVEKLDLLLKIRDELHVNWSGKHRSALCEHAIYPRPLQAQLPIWLGVGSTPSSFERGGLLGLPLMIAVIGQEADRFRPLVNLYREVGSLTGHVPEKLKIGVHAMGFLGESTQQAADDFFQAMLPCSARSAESSAGQMRRGNSST